jgi:hypothetical protein
MKMPIGVSGDFCTQAERAEDDQDVFDLAHFRVFSALPGNAVSRCDPARRSLVGFVAARLRVQAGARGRWDADLLRLSRGLLITLGFTLCIILGNRR